MISLILGLIFATLGVCGLIFWQLPFWILVKVLLCVSLIFAGFLGIVMGLSKLGEKSSYRRD